jgi:hypothetical protein
MGEVTHDPRQPQAFGRFLLTLLGCRHAPTPQTQTTDQQRLIRVWVPRMTDAASNLREVFRGQTNAHDHTRLIRRVKWSRLSEQIFRIDKWSLCQGSGSKHQQ